MQPGWLVLSRFFHACVPPVRHSLIARQILMGALIAVVLASPLAAASLDLTFLRGLREHGLYDYALFEIDRLKSRPNLSPEQTATLDFERAITQLQSARSLANAASQTRELERAAAALER